VAIQHVQKQPVPLKDIRPDLPIELCNLVHRMMAKKPDERIQTGREIAREAARLRDTLVGVGTTPGGSGLISKAAAAGGKSGQEGFIVQVGPTEPNPAFDAALTQTLPRYFPRRWLAGLALVTVVLALGVGLAFGWWQGRDQTPPTTVQPPSATAEVPPPPKSTLRQAAEEKRLLEAIQAMESNRDDANVIKYRVELGLYYLKEWRLDDAEKVFKVMEELNKEKDRAGKGYGGNAFLGKAMVLAFRDNPKESNALFLKLLATNQKKGKEPPVVAPLLLRRPEVAEMVAKALNHNLLNSPSTFPPALRVYLAPPAPKVKTADKTAG